MKYVQRTGVFGLSPQWQNAIQKYVRLLVEKELLRETLDLYLAHINISEWILRTFLAVGNRWDKSRVKIFSGETKGPSFPRLIFPIHCEPLDLPGGFHQEQPFEPMTSGLLPPGRSALETAGGLGRFWHGTLLHVPSHSLPEKLHSPPKAKYGTNGH